MKSASVFLNLSADVGNLQMNWIIIATESALGPKLEPQRVKIFSLACACMKAFPMSPQTTFRLWASATKSNRRTDKPFTTVARVDRPLGSTLLPSRIYRAVYRRSGLIS